MNTPELTRAGTVYTMRTLLFVAAAGLAGCAVNPGNPVTDVQADIAAITPVALQQITTDDEQQQVNQHITQLLSQPLTLDSAVHIALLNNKVIQAELFALGVSAAELQQMTQLPNPAISISRELSEGESSTELEFGINLLSLLILPKVRQLETLQFAKAKLQIAQRIATIIANTHQAYWQAVAMQEMLHYTEQVYTTTEAGAELAKRMLQAGNFNKLDYLREQSLLSEAALNLVKARHNAVNSKEALQQQLGIWQPGAVLRLPDKLPSIPAEPMPWQQVANEGMAKRLDIRLAKLQLQYIGQSAGLTNATRFINAFEVEAGGDINDSSDRHYSMVLELPIFDFGAYRVKKAENQYKQAFNLAYATGVTARAELTQRYVSYRAAFDIARHYQHALLPIQRQIAAENQLRYNGMFISVFELIADARNQVNTVTGFVNASRDFWLARSQLDFALLGISIAPANEMEVPAVSAGQAAGH